MKEEGSESRQQSRARRRLAFRWALGLVLLLVIPVAGQAPYQLPPTIGGRNGQPYPDSNVPGDQGPNGTEHKRIKLLNAARQKSLVSDADKLLKLAKELNDEVTDGGSQTLNSQQLHKLEEIGKLAKSVKEKMSYSVGGYPSLNAPLTYQPGIQ